MRTRLGRLVAAACVATSLATACTLSVGEGGPGVTPSRVVVTKDPVAMVPTGPGTAAAALKRLCGPPKIPPGHPDAPAGDTPAAIAAVEHQVESVRGMRFDHPVAVDPLTPAQLDARLTKNFDKTYPKAFYDRRSEAWRTLGVIPPDADIRSAQLAFQTQRVLGFYNPATGKLVYAGAASDLSLNERFTLAHELTHALDDQRFDLSRLDPIAAKCQDERFQAALGGVEGSAQYYGTQVITRFPGGEFDDSGGGSTAGVPPFIQGMAFWPYIDGPDFIAALVDRGGVDSVNRAIEDFPVSTEQVIHPERYPNDLPQAVDIPDLSTKLGAGWRDLDVMPVGEEFLREMLRLRMDAAVADDAAAGWDGGLYRAWTDGTHTALVLRTAWDTPEDAEAFLRAAQEWQRGSDTPSGAVLRQGTQVDLVFADDPAALDPLGVA